MKLKLPGWVYKIQISQKLVLSYLLVILLPLSLLFIFISQRLMSLTSQQFIAASTQTVAQAAEFLSFKLNGVANITNAAAYDPEKYIMMAQDPSLYSLPDQIYDAWQITNSVDSLRLIDPSIKIHMYVNDNLYYANEEILFHPLSRIMKNAWLEKMISKDEISHWYHTEEIDPKPSAGKPETISVVRRIIDPQSYNMTLAVLRADVSINDIQKIMQKAVTAKESRVWLTSGDGSVLTSFGSQSGQDPSRQTFLSCIDSSGWQHIWLDGQNFLFTSLPVGKTGLYLVASLLQAEPYHQSDRIRFEFFIAVAIITVSALLMSLWFSKSISSRLRRIIARMKHVQQGNMQLIHTDMHQDEIGELINTYNFMVGRINELADESFEMGKEARGHEMSALQGQINPHFLYNMLDLINLTALDKDVKDVAELVRMLARFYRLGLNRGRDTVTIRDEIEHVSLYFAMQNRRFGDRIQYFLNIEEDILPLRVLKIVLQPIVENAVLHGILCQREGRGSVWIEARKLENQYIQFSIGDDGVGIPEDKLATLLDKEGMGYGLYNVHRRLCIFYGEESGLIIESKPNHGTSVSFKIPIEKAVI